MSARKPSYRYHKARDCAVVTIAGVGGPRADRACRPGRRRRGPLALLDEFGTADVDVGAGPELQSEGELVLAEGAVEVRHGAAALRAQSVEAWHPGVMQGERREAA
jgi:hypothetical protein